MSYKTQTKTASKRYFDKIDRAVIRDTKLSASLQRTFNILVDAAPIDGIFTINYMSTLAERQGFADKRNFRRNVAKLEKIGLVKRIYRKSPHNPRMNLANCFIIIGSDAPCYEDSPFRPDTPMRTGVGANQPSTGGYLTPQESVFFRESSEREINTKNTLKREVPTPFGGYTAVSPVEDERAGEVFPCETGKASVAGKDERQNPEPCWIEAEIEATPKTEPKQSEAYNAKTSNPTPSGETATVVSQAITASNLADVPADVPADMPADVPADVPAVMVETALYWLRRTGRRVLLKNEIEVLQQLERTHTPKRVQKAIDKAIDCWFRQGKEPQKQNFAYIGTMLKHQRSYDPAKKRTQNNKKAVQSEVSAQPVEEKPVVELAMPLEAAEKVIAEYKPAGVLAEPFPLALAELFDGIKAKDIELTEERMAALPKDADGVEIEPEDDAEFEALYRGIDLPDYLRLKFPNATDAELSMGKLSSDEKTQLTTAMEIDKSCVYCDNPKECRLPVPFKPGNGRPVATLSNGHVSAGRIPRLHCKHECATCSVSPEFERLRQASGLAEMEYRHTFTEYRTDGATAEVVVAKARAMLAAQNGTNLILGGRPGTGKTHLATAIALEVMSTGRRAIVQNMPELLDGICRAHQNYTDPSGLMNKYKTVPCLVLDDWGKERTSDARMDYLYQIIDYRYKHGLQTIVTTNAVTPDGLKNKFNADKIDPLVSRILSNGEWITIQDAADYRLKPKVADPVAAPASEPVQETPVAKPTQEAPVPEPVQVVPSAESGVSPSSGEQAETPAEIATQSDEKALEGEVVSSAGANTPEPSTASGQSENLAPALASEQPQAVEIVVPEPQPEMPSESDEKGLKSEVADGTGASTPDEAVSPQSDEDDPCVDGDIFDWETGQVYSQEYLDSWEAEIRELEEQSREEPDLPDEDERRWSS